MCKQMCCDTWKVTWGIVQSTCLQEIVLGKEWVPFIPDLLYMALSGIRIRWFGAAHWTSCANTILLQTQFYNIINEQKL